MRDHEHKLPDLTGVNRGVQVLLVEDDDVYAGVVSRILADDKRVEVALRARDGVEAEELLEQNEWPDLIITDLAMPKVDGAELLRRIRVAERERRRLASPATRRPCFDEVVPRLPIVVMTSSDKALDFRNVIDADATSFITKPRDLGELRILLRALVRSVIWGEALPSILTVEDLRASAQRPAMVCEG